MIQPEGVEKLISNGWNFDKSDIDELVFEYTYDGLNRMITKKVPGAGLTEMVYDRFDRLVASRDAKMTTEQNGCLQSMMGRIGQ